MESHQLACQVEEKLKASVERAQADAVEIECLLKERDTRLWSVELEHDLAC